MGFGSLSHGGQDAYHTVFCELENWGAEGPSLKAENSSKGRSNLGDQIPYPGLLMWEKMRTNRTCSP